MNKTIMKLSEMLNLNTLWRKTCRHYWRTNNKP